MNSKNLLVSALLLSAHTGQLMAHDIQAIQQTSDSDVEGSVAFSKIIKTANGKFAVSASLVPVKSGDYTFVVDGEGDSLSKVPGNDPGLEYQLNVKVINLATGESLTKDAQYFVKSSMGPYLDVFVTKTTTSQLKAYFCDTTAVCSEDRGSIEMSIKDGVLKISDISFFLEDGKDLLNGELSLKFHDK